jgi:multiple sugar transport system substrate-binding protein/sn-glycerol 3-phosphate transport system substrate-binding protein
MKRRTLFAVLIIVLSMGLILASCKSLPYDTEIYGEIEKLDPSGQVITYWYQHHSHREEVLQAMIGNFNATNKWGITVNGEQAGGYNEIYTKVIAGIQLGVIPDIVVAYQNQAATYVTMNGVVELTPYIESLQWGFTDEENEDFFPFVSLGDYLPQFDGRYGFPPQRSMEVLYYNEDWLSELGYSHPPRSWDEFLEIACVASDPDAGTYGYALDIDASTFAAMLYNRGGSMVNDDATAYTFGDQAGLDVLTLLRDLFTEDCAILIEGYDDQEVFGTAKAVFMISSTSSIPYVRDEVEKGAGFNWSISTFPTTLNTPKVNIYGASLSILPTTPEKQLAAWLFIKWLTEPEQSAHWSRETNYFPVRRSAASELVDYFAENPQYEKAFGFLSHDMAIEPGVAGYDECRDTITEMMAAAVVGGDPTTLLPNTIEECNIFLAEAAPD